MRNKIFDYIGFFVCLFLVGLFFNYDSIATVIGRFILHDTTGATLTLKDNFVPVVRQEKHSQLIELYLTSEVDSSVSIFTNTSLDDTTITITSVVTPTTSHMLCIKEATHFYQGNVLSVAASGANWDVTLDTPLDYAFTTAANIGIRSRNLAVNGSVTPVEFSISPFGLTSSTVWDITRLIIIIEDNVAMDQTTLGGIAAVTNGLVFRSVNGITKNIFNMKKNGDCAAHAFDIEFDDRASPSTLWGFRCRKSIAGEDKSGVTLRLSADTADELKAIVYDDLTGISDFRVVLMGNEVE